MFNVKRNTNNEKRYITGMHDRNLLDKKCIKLHEILWNLIIFATFYLICRLIPTRI